MTTKYTVNYNLEVPDFNDPTWAPSMQRNFYTLDSLLYTVTGVSGIRGAWLNSTMYAVDDRVVDPLDGSSWRCLVNHTSAAADATFAEDRAANPSYWHIVQLVPTSRGDWLTATKYYLNESVLHDDVYYTCRVIHTSGVFATDLSMGDWAVVFDFSTVDTIASDAALAAIAGDVATCDTNANNAAASATAAAASAALAQAAASGITNAVVFKGPWDASSGSFPGGGTAQNGWQYVVTTGGTVNSISFASGDSIVAIMNNASTSTYAANWQKLGGALTSGQVTTALGFTPVTNARLVSAGGIATGGGDLTADRTITVTKAAGSDITTGTDDNKAVTSKALADAGLKPATVTAAINSAVSAGVAGLAPLASPAFTTAATLDGAALAKQSYVSSQISTALSGYATVSYVSGVLASYATNSALASLDSRVSSLEAWRASSGGGGSSCFIAGTYVLMADGTSRVIEDIQVGDLVMSYGRASGRVIGLNRPTLGKRKMLVLNKLRGTPEHLFFSKNKPVTFDLNGYKRETGVAQPFIGVDGIEATAVYPGIAGVRQISAGVLDALPTPVAVKPVFVDAPYNTKLYNLAVDGSHTYYAEGFLVGGWERDDDFDYLTWEERHEPVTAHG